MLGQYHSIPDKTKRIRITPFVGFLGEIDPTKVRFNTDEVSRVFALSFEYLLDTNKRGMMHVRGLDIPYWHLPQEVSKGQEIKLWGLTAYVMHSTLRDVFVGNCNIYA